MAGRSRVTASEQQKAALETLAASRDRGEAERAKSSRSLEALKKQST
jgi:hypothetical protein